MKAYEIGTSGGIDALKIVERPTPKPGHGQVVVRMRATSLNYRDLVIAKGGLGKRERSLIPLSDGAGEVVELGPGVTRVRAGDRVAPIFTQTWLGGDIGRNLPTALGGEIDGVLAEYVVLNQDGLVHFPDHLSFEEAATLPCAAVTAWNALITVGQLRAGDTVLVMGTGGVSIFALQFARITGARVIATSSSDAKLARLREMGATEVINYRTTPEWGKRTFELTAHGVDHVVEVGGAGTLANSFEAVRPGGRISLIGLLTGFGGEFNPLVVLFKSVCFQGIRVGSREMFEAMNRAIAAAQLRPVIDRTFPFAEAPQAYRHLESGAHFGKVCIRI
ncbi:MAG: NAD(P)-dependent alcohol dehydrogenase [Candidatus Binataceae bacterium]|jgi:NADPH:quinone reductase-like Zn-dependent oxidoreductase